MDPTNINVQTSIKQLNDVEYELEIDATATELAPKINKRIREHQATISLKGFRPGKVPVNLLKKMYGESLVMDVIEKSVMGIFSDEVIEEGEYEVLGMPVLSALDYKLDGDLHAVMKFGVKPNIELSDLSGTTILKLVHTVSEDEIDQEIDNLLKKEADLQTREEGGIEETDHVVVDMQRLDPQTATPIVGEREEGLEFFLDDGNLKKGLKNALLGKAQGETFKVSLSLNDDEDDDDDDTPKSDILVLPTDSPDTEKEFDSYEVHVKEVKQRLMPELDEEFIKEITKEAAEDEEGLRNHIQEQLVSMWDNESQRLLEGELISKMIELHAFAVPESALDVYLNSFVEELKQQAGGNLPDGFDVETYKTQRKGEAENLARWQLIREHITDAESLEVTEEDRDAYFAKMGGNEEMATMLKNYYASMGNNMLERVDHELLNKKVIGVLSDRFNIEEKTKDEFTQALKERAEGMQTAE